MKIFVIYHKTSEDSLKETSSYKKATSKRDNSKKQTRPTHITLYMRWLSEEERRVDALALRADERRDKLR